MKTLSILLALVNSLFAGVILLASLTNSEIRDAILLWTFIKVVAALGVILIGGLTWLGNVISIRSGLIALGSLALVALGAATIVWTYHLAVVRGDMEYYMIAYGGSLMMQGMASLLGIADGTRNMTTS
ncbi:MAG: hypothetical protein C3F07_06275 [Anaerolineales bacterium]|nr:hypothetical protein [Anaerolineae bacterium]PWB75045.1 MAG: hypothetical protein C3F07_06275 [Anaerolineales bacterium]